MENQNQTMKIKLMTTVAIALTALIATSTGYYFGQRSVNIENAGRSQNGTTPPKDEAHAANDSSKITILIEIHAKPGQEDFTRETFVSTIQTSHKPGILSAQIYENKMEPGVFYSVQEWENLAAFEEHMRAAQSSEEKFEEVTSMLSEVPKTSVLIQIN